MNIINKYKVYHKIYADLAIKMNKTYSLGEH